MAFAPQKILTPTKGETAGAAPGENPDGGLMMYPPAGDKKDEAYAQAFSQGLGLGIFPKGDESDPTESRCIEGFVLVNTA